MIKGLICAGGSGTRMGELCRITNKHLIPVGNWPMVYYPMTTLQKIGIQKVMIVTGPGHAGGFIDLLGDGTVTERFSEKLLFNLELTYRLQSQAGGIAQAIALAEDFIRPQEKFVVILGDNIFQEDLSLYAAEFEALPPGHSLILLKTVTDPERFGVAELANLAQNTVPQSRKIDPLGKIQRLIEKPGVLSSETTPSKLAVTGVYFFDDSIFDIIKNLKPSSRGELEITDVNKEYLAQDKLHYAIIDGWWKDVGKPEAIEEVVELLKNSPIKS